MLKKYYKFLKTIIRIYNHLNKGKCGISTNTNVFSSMYFRCCTS